ncbi:MAG: hypothetical protein QXD43_05385 [Candidatus Aenigmatarchaeota archaeon]
MKIKIYFFVGILFFLSYFAATISYAENENLYFSYKKSKNNILIGIEGYVYYKNKKYYSNELNYEWAYIINDQLITQKTYSPFLVINTNQDLITLNIKAFPSDMKFIKTLGLTIDLTKNNEKPSAVIVKYNPDLNIILPYSKINTGEKLYALSYGFSSKNLIYEWVVLDKKYYGIIFDPKNLEQGTIINLIIKDKENPNIFAKDIKIL